MSYKDKDKDKIKVLQGYNEGSSVWAVDMPASEFFDALDSKNKWRTGYKGKNWKPRKIDYGVAPIQMKLVLSFIAKIYVDMKANMKNTMNWLKGFKAYENASSKEVFKAAMALIKEEYSNFKKDFEATGSVSKCPTYVYFLD